MSSSPNFVKILSASDLLLNQLQLPHAFCLKYSSNIPSDVKINIRNGYCIWLEFNKHAELFKGIHIFYRHFELVEGQSLLFDYVGGYNFKTTIINDQGCEIEYPAIVHPFQSSHPQPVSLRDGGFKFVKYMSISEAVVDEICLPDMFSHRCGSFIPPSFEFKLNGSFSFPGFYLRNQRKVTGLGKLCQILGIENLNCFQVLVFTYDLAHTFNISVYDGSLTEYLVLANSISNEQSSCLSNTAAGETNPLSNAAFEIVIKPYHMLPYCHGVEVPSQFKEVRNEWDSNDIITAYKGNLFWELKIRKRADMKRTAIYSGWIQLREALNLSVGDVCVFEKKDNTLRAFNVRVVKKF